MFLTSLLVASAVAAAPFDSWTIVSSTLTQRESADISVRNVIKLSSDPMPYGAATFTWTKYRTISGADGDEAAPWNPDFTPKQNVGVLETYETGPGTILPRRRLDFMIRWTWNEGAETWRNDSTSIEWTRNRNWHLFKTTWTKETDLTPPPPGGGS